MSSWSPRTFDPDLGESLRYDSQVSPSARRIHCIYHSLFISYCASWVASSSSPPSSIGTLLESSLLKKWISASNSLVSFIIYRSILSHNQVQKMPSSSTTHSNRIPILGNFRFLWQFSLTYFSLSSAMKLVLEVLAYKIKRNWLHYFDKFLTIYCF